MSVVVDMAFPRIVIASRVTAGRLLMHQRSDIQCLISIGGPGDRQPAGYLRVAKRLRLVFSDIEEQTDGDVAPSRADVEKIVSFAPVVAGCSATTLIHCEAGISRSSAAALIVLATIAGPDREAAAVAELLRIHPDACPNDLMISLADDLLARAGRLVAALAEAEAETR